MIVVREKFMKLSTLRSFVTPRNVSSRVIASEAQNYKRVVLSSIHAFQLHLRFLFFFSSLSLSSPCEFQDIEERREGEKTTVRLKNILPVKNRPRSKGEAEIKKTDTRGCEFRRKSLSQKNYSTWVYILYARRVQCSPGTCAFIERTVPRRSYFCVRGQLRPAFEVRSELLSGLSLLARVFRWRLPFPIFFFFFLLSFCRDFSFAVAFHLRSILPLSARASWNSSRFSSPFVAD